MNKVAFLIENHNDLRFVITYFENYKIPSEFVQIDDDHLIAGVVGNIPKDIQEGCLKYKYNNIEIDVFSSFKKINESEYDKIYEFLPYWRGATYENKNTDRYEKIFLNIGERTNVVDDTKSELNGNKLISGANCQLDNVFYDFKLNLIYFYYFFGFNYLRFKYREVTKDNLLGMYWMPGYKKVRDEQVEKIKKLSNFNIDFYSDRNELSTYEWLSILTFDSWHRNHIASWTDYETSVVGYVFETLHHNTTYESNNRLEYIGEKTLKSLLFSFLRMPFILDCNPYSFIDLVKDGYWFLNSEYFTYHEDDDVDTLIQKFSKSIDDTISYLSELNAIHLGDLKKVSHSLYTEHKDKIDNNFKKILNDVHTPEIGDSLLNFILK